RGHGLPHPHWPLHRLPAGSLRELLGTSRAAAGAETGDALLRPVALFGNPQGPPATPGAGEFSGSTGRNQLRSRVLDGSRFIDPPSSIDPTRLVDVQSAIHPGCRKS